MHRFIAGTCTMRLTITPQEPWIVRGETKKEPFVNHKSTPDTHPLKDRQGNLLLPASSLKGVLRSTAERILRTMQPQRDPTLRPLADIPFVHKKDELSGLSRGAIADSELVEWNTTHHRYNDDELKPERVYRILSPASQLFGCTLHAGLVTLDDASVQQKTWRRSHVAIDRFTGGVGEGPFIEELSPAIVPLNTRLTITNFALWHIALLALVFQEINHGYAAIGGGTRKGQGQMRIDVPRVDISYAEKVYGESSGIISAQARLTDAPWNATDVPPDVVAAERTLALLETLKPQELQGWFASGTVSMAVQGPQVETLFRKAVEQAWRAWIQVVREETQETIA